MHERDPLHRLARLLARDRPIDWNSSERSAQNERERGFIRQLRLVAAMAAFHRTAQAGDSSPDLSMSVSIARSSSRLDGNLPPLAGESQPVLPPGSRWGHLEILERVGHGAFGQVYRARDTRLDREVALKLLSGDDTAPGDATVREARLLARVRHPNVVTVHGADRIDGRIGIWMEFVRGQRLDEILRTRGLFDAREALLAGVDLCRALSAVHAAGIAHRDIKPGNVMRAEGGRIVLMDLGLGLEVKRERAGDAVRTLSGTPLFMAPEVLEGQPADARSDVYSLGVVLFMLVTGSLPVQANTLAALRARHAGGALRRARDLRPDLPEAFARVLDGALAADPERRFATPGEMERELLHTLGASLQPTTASGAGRRWMRRAAIATGAGGTLLMVMMAPRWLGSRQIPTPGARAVPLANAPSHTLLGEESGDMFGFAVAGLGDVDQDGFDDVLIGASEARGGGSLRGKLYLYRGSRSGLDSLPSWTAVGQQDSSYLGMSIASFTTLAFDGFADVVAGEPGAESVRLYRGSTRGLGNTPDQILRGGTRGTLFGYALATGDVNHDGFDDLLVGEPHYPTKQSRHGRVSLYLSESDQYAETPVWSHVGPAGSCFGLTVALPDIDHDGYADAVIGAPCASLGSVAACGSVYVFKGTAAGLDSVPTMLPGLQADAGLGRDVVATDLNGDGFEDIVAGAESASNGEDAEGLAQVYWGSRTGILPLPALHLETNTMGANFGGHMGALGDLDGDGCAEVFIGAIRFQKSQPREGAAFIYSGSKASQVVRTWSRMGGKAGSWYGSAGCAAGDVNGDGFPDVLIAAQAWDTEAGANVGRVDLFMNTRRR